VNLLGEVVAEGKRHVKFEGINTEIMALASIKATQTGKAQLNGHTINAIKGILQNDVDSQQLTTLFPGEVPASLPKHT
ncbi:YcjX family protein, partial [Staphylococcus pasteuri_A]